MNCCKNRANLCIDFTEGNGIAMCSNIDYSESLKYTTSRGENNE